MTERDPISTPALPGGLPFDASQIQFTPAGAGAVARPVQEDLREVGVSVFRFMSAAQKADVTARTALIDVTAALAAAEASLEPSQLIGGTLFFPPGIYLHNWAPSWNGLVLRGAGRLATVLKGNGAGTAALSVVGISRVRVQNLTVDGAGVKANAVDIHATAGLTQAVEHLWENVFFTGATTDNLSIGDAASHQASQLTFINCGAWGGTPSNSNIKIQGSNTLGISWHGGQIGSQAIVKNVDMQNGELTAYNPDWNGATGYDVVAVSGQFRSFGGHSESVAFFNSSAADPQTDQSAVHAIYGFQGSNSGATGIYHQAPRTLRIQASIFAGNIRIGNGAILEGESIRFAGASGYVEDAGAINRVFRSVPWTPTPKGQTSAGTGQTGTFTGEIVRSGKTVTASFAITLTNRGNGTGNLLIGPLPYPIVNNANIFFGSIRADTVTYPAGTSQLSIFAGGAVNSTSLLIMASGTGIASGFVQIDTQVANTSVLQGSVTYETSN